MDNEKKVTETNYFTELNAINVNKHVEKKGQFNYLSWAYAVAELLKRHPNATWEIIEYNGLPYNETPLGFFVKVAVTVNNVTRSQIHPVLDNNNRPIVKPTSFQINTSIQRCLVKAISLHGLGLYIYAGEDLPDGAESTTESEEKTKEAEKEADRSGDSAIKSKWGLLAGNLDGYEEGIKKLRNKGMTWAQIEAALTDKIKQKQAKAEENPNE
jgi:hypothetical protein